jgi:hypothetical protein
MLALEVAFFALACFLVLALPLGCGGFLHPDPLFGGALSNLSVGFGLSGLFALIWTLPFLVVDIALGDGGGIGRDRKKRVLLSGALTPLATAAAAFLWWTHDPNGARFERHPIPLLFILMTVGNAPPRVELYVAAAA